MPKGLFLAAAIGAAAALTAFTAQALPLSAPGVAAPADQMIQVRQGCGAGYHRGPYGGCRRNTAPVGPRGANACWFRNGVKICR